MTKSLQRINAAGKYAQRINDTSKTFRRIKPEKVAKALGGEEIKVKPWTQTIRRESGLVEHICRHGVGHPALGSVHWMELNGVECMGIHGCDGCCHDIEWKLADVIEGLIVACSIGAKNKIQKISILASLESFVNSDFKSQKVKLDFLYDMLKTANKALFDKIMAEK